MRWFEEYAKNFTEKAKKMETINLSEDDCYTQRNNVIRPGAACMPTDRVMFYLGNKIPFVIPQEELDKKTQPEDYFMALLTTPEAYNKCYQLSPWIKKNNEDPNKKRHIYPNEDHFMYPNYLDALVCGKVVSGFSVKFTYEKVIEYIDNGKVIMTTATFPDANIAGHAICIIGRRGDTLFLADPYGNFHTNYTDKKGYKIEMTKEEFAKHILGDYPDNSELKYGHFPL